MIRKRSVMLKGHATSVSLEDEYWTELKRMADAEGIALAQLIERIDTERRVDNLSSALRLAVLADLKERAIPGPRSLSGS
jgi:predicted DNA-binding ribbon-helix-helix protein